MAKKFTLRRATHDEDPTILDSLNPVQREAAEHVDGPLLILAGAGSGKTRVITHRIAHMVRNVGIPPDQILAVTFTNKAAGEMRERVDELLGAELASEAWRVTISTFHSLCARLLRKHADKLGLDNRFVIYDDSDQKALIKQVLQDNDRTSDRAEIRRLRDFIETMKNAAKTPEQAHELAYSSAAEENVWFYETYQRALRDANCVDFGDLILGVLEIFRKDEKLARRYSTDWQYVMVDEFQDTNPAQYELLEHLIKEHDNLCVVGDDDQAIYRWRGATIANILGFDDDFPETKVVKLEQNYRSTQVILDAANDVIQHNEGRHDKKLWTEHAGGDPIVCFAARDDREEAIWTAQKIAELRSSGIDYPDMAIFYRTNAQGRSFEEQLRFAGIPYQVVGGLSFYSRAEIKDILAYLKVALNPSNEVDLLRVINTPTRGIGGTTLDKIRVAAALPQMGSIWNVIDWYVLDEGRPTTDEPPPGWLPGVDANMPIDPELQEVRDLSSRPASGLRTFHEIITGLQRELEDESLLAPTVQRLMETIDYRSHLEKTDSERAEDKERNVHELVNAIDEFEKTELVDRTPIETLRAFLDRSSLLASQDNIDDELGAVTLMTVHSSKGLEFDAVFMAGMEDELFPSLREETDEELEEERRLAYVAITRARQRLFVSYAQRRRIFGQYRDCTPSRFLEDIEPERLALDPRSMGGLPRGRSRRRRDDPSRSWGRKNIGRQHDAWEFDQSAEMQVGSVARTVAAQKLAAQKKAPHDEFSQEVVYDDFSQEEFVPPASGDEQLIDSVCSHSVFGMGRISNVSGTGPMATLTIEFANGEEKKIKRKFVKIFG